MNRTETKSMFLFTIITEPEVNNCFNIFFIGDYLERNKRYTFLPHLIDKTASAAKSLR